MSEPFRTPELHELLARIRAGDRTAQIWDAATGEEIAVLSGHDGPVSSVHFSADGARIVTASDKTARIWDAATGGEIAVLRGNEHILLKV